MKCKFENIGNLDSAEFEINTNMLNIKYGYNGIGKSTIAKAFKYYYGNQTEKDELEPILNPLGNDKKIQLKIIDDSNPTINKVAIFDNSFFNTLFKQTDLLNDSYEILIRDDDYLTFMNSITISTKAIQELIYKSKYKELTDLRNDFENELCIKNKKGKTPYSSKSPMNKYLNCDMSIKNAIPQELPKEYYTFVLSQFRSEWYSWIMNSNENFFKYHICPCCGQEFAGNLLTKIQNLKKLNEKKEFAEYDKEQSIVTNTAKFIVDKDLKTSISNLNTYKGKATEEILEPLNEGRTFFRKEYEKISYLLNLQAKTFLDAKRERKFDILIKTLKSNKLDPNFCLTMDDDLTITNSINNKIEDIIAEITKVNASIGIAYSELRKKIKKNEKLINEFMRIAGIPYIVRIQQNDDIHFDTLFSYYKSDDSKDFSKIDNQIRFLSYGEANCLSLLLFCIEHIKDDKTLLIFDDPVSSYDSNKKYAIYNYLFSKKGILKNKTSIMLTHDYETLIMLLKCKIINRDSASFNYLTRKDFKLSEKKLTYDNIVKTSQIFLNIARDENRTLIARIVAARSYFSMTNNKDKGNIYDILSSLIHFHKEPNKKGEDLKIDDKEMDDINRELKTIFDDENYSYDAYSKIIKNDEELIKDYRNTKNKFDKICIIRNIYKKNMVDNIYDSVVLNFINEMFHIENMYVYSYEDAEFFDVPDYIMCFCDNLIDNLTKKDKDNNRDINRNI